MSQFLHSTNWKDIQRGFEFEAALPFPSDTKRPLTFFIPDPNDPTKGTLQHTIGNFRPGYKDNRPVALTQQIVMQIKPRRVVVLSTDEINTAEQYEYVIVAPIFTIKGTDKQKPWYPLVKNDKHPFFVDLSDEKAEKYVDLSQITTIHKSLLLFKRNTVDPNRWEVVEDTLIQCLSLGVGEEMEENILLEETKTPLK